MCGDSVLKLPVERVRGWDCQREFVYKDGLFCGKAAVILFCLGTLVSC